MNKSTALIQNPVDDYALKRHHNFQHSLSHHPLLQLEELKKLALRSPKIRFHSAMLKRTQPFDTARELQTGMTIEETLNNIEASGSFVYLMEVEKDPLYRDLIQTIMANIEKNVHRHDSKMCKPKAWIFITSPGGVTPYHRDFNANYFFQIKGQKTLWLWDHTDREIVGQEEDEAFHGVHSLAKTLYTDEKMKKAVKYEMGPSSGAFFSYTDPHLVENGSEEVSISLSITFLTPEDYQVKRIHKINQLLRKVGIIPSDIGKSKLLNQMKLGLHWLVKHTIYLKSPDWEDA